MILRDGRHGVDNDIRIRISRLNGLHQRGVVADEILHLHAGIVGAKVITTRRGFILATACAMV